MKVVAFENCFGFIFVLKFRWLSDLFVAFNTAEDLEISPKRGGASTLERVLEERDMLSEDCLLPLLVYNQ